MIISYKKHSLQFKKPAGTSRSVLLHNDVWFIFIESEGKIGVGECNPLVGLSLDDRSDFEEKLQFFITKFMDKQSIDLEILNEFPAIKFGFECALKDLEMGAKKILFPTKFTEGLDSISINGLLWMGSKEYMLEQLKEKLNDGFSCIKMKIGSIDFIDELAILKAIRSEYSADQIEIRVDANGAFKPSEALDKLNTLSKFSIHSIEQPIDTGQWKEMQSIVKNTPIPIAIDEELIPLRDKIDRERMLSFIKPHYIILKPSLVGGFDDSNKWMSIADSLNIDWWLTSALESNIGLNAIAQYAYSKNVKLPQGLGTGSLYSNNIDSPLYISEGKLHFNALNQWEEI